MELPIKYRKYNGYLEARWGVAEEWKRIRPTKAKTVTPITQNFGNDFMWNLSTHPEWKGKWFYKEILGLDTGHNGIDMDATIGTCLYAPESGKITVVRELPGGGKEIRLLGVSGEHVFYHLSEFIAQVGAKVKQGELIALTGNTGMYTTAPHKHWGLKVDGKYINQRPLLNFDIYTLPYKDGHYLWRTEITEGAKGQFYKVVEGELKFLDSKKNPATREIPIVSEVLKVLNDGIEPHTLHTITEKEFNKFNQLI